LHEQQRVSTDQNKKIGERRANERPQGKKMLLARAPMFRTTTL